MRAVYLITVMHILLVSQALARGYQASVFTRFLKNSPIQQRWNTIERELLGLVRDPERCVRVDEKMYHVPLSKPTSNMQWCVPVLYSHHQQLQVILIT